MKGHILLLPSMALLLAACQPQTLANNVSDNSFETIASERALARKAADIKLLTQQFAALHGPSREAMRRAAVIEDTFKCQLQGETKADHDFVNHSVRLYVSEDLNELERAYLNLLKQGYGIEFVRVDWEVDANDVAFIYGYNRRAEELFTSAHDRIAFDELFHEALESMDTRNHYLVSLFFVPWRWDDYILSSMGVIALPAP